MYGSGYKPKEAADADDPPISREQMDEEITCCFAWGTGILFVLVLVLVQLSPVPPGAGPGYLPPESGGGLPGAHGYTFGMLQSQPHAGVQTRDGGFLMVGDGVDYYADPASGVARSMQIAKTDRDGGLQWKHMLGICGYNYGKFGIELADGTFLVAGALCVKRPDGSAPNVMKRALVRLSATGEVLYNQTFANLGESALRRDGIMGVTEVLGTGTIVATGFVGGVPKAGPVTNDGNDKVSRAHRPNTLLLLTVTAASAAFYLT